MPDSKLFKQHLAPLLAQLQLAKHRQLLLITGEKSWCYKESQALTSQLTANIYILENGEQLSNSQWPEHTHQILGQEFDHVVYDGFSGIYPDKFAALSGTVRAGGLMVVLLPNLCDLTRWHDPALSKFQSHGHYQTLSYFNQRLAVLISKLDIAHFDQQTGWQSTPVAKHTAIDKPAIIELDLTEQQHCIEQIIKTANGRANRPLLISADRGRGKSAALGFAAAELTDKNIIICATQPRAVQTSFKHLASQLNLPLNKAQKKLANLSYVAPDVLLDTLPKCDILFVDEAAAIPVPILLKILASYPRIVFASTIIGYEGNGRGYTLRFKRHLQQHYKNMRSVTLEQPIRFAKYDLLEQHIRTLLALDTSYQATNFPITTVTHHKISQQQLIDDEAQLRQIISLLALAHYQTTVNDLRQILDGTKQKLFISKVNEQIIGVCLVAIEGGFDAGLAEQIVEKERRPQGHLLAQTLAQISFDSSVIQQSTARIVRIAVAPEYHNQGLGQQLLGFVEQQVKATCAWIGASFGVNSPLLAFWQKSLFNLVKIGYKADKTTAEHAALVIKPLTINSELVNRLELQFSQHFSIQLLTHFSHLEPTLVSTVMSKLPHTSLSQNDKNHLKQLLSSNYTLFDIQPLLWRIIWCYPDSLKNCSDDFQWLLIRLALQGWSLEEAKNTLNLTGKNSINQLFKQAVNDWYKKNYFRLC